MACARPRPQSWAYFLLPPASPVRGLCASVVRPPPHPAPLPARDSLEGSVPAERSEEGAGGSSGGWLAWLPVFLTFLCADSSLPCNFLFRGQVALATLRGAAG